MMATNQTLFADMSRTQAKVLDRYPNLPSVASVAIGESTIGQQGTFRTVIKLQMSGDALSSIPAWAVEFGTTVRFLDKTEYVEVTTEAVVDGHVVVAWDLLAPEEGERLAAVLGVESVAHMDAVEPVRLLDVAALVTAVKEGAA